MHFEEALASAGDVPAMLRPNRRLTALAHALAEAARNMLPAQADMILGVARNRSDLRLLWWDRNFILSAEITVPTDAFFPEHTSEGAVQRTGAALIDYLAGRWPQHAAPTEIGVITDGRGVAFSPARPSPAAPGWLAHHVAGGVPLQMILPLDSEGPCGLLIRAPANRSVH